MVQFGEVTHQYNHYSNIAKSYVLEKLPALGGYNNFQLFVLLNIVLLLAVGVINWYRDTTIWGRLSPRRIWKNLFRFLRVYFPPIRNKVDSELAKVAPEIHNSIPKEYRSSIKKLPHKSNLPDIGNATEKEAVKGYLSGSRYPLKEHSDLVANLSGNFAYANPLHFDIHPCVRQMEV